VWQRHGPAGPNLFNFRTNGNLFHYETVGLLDSTSRHFFFLGATSERNQRARRTMKKTAFPSN
jgi:hypothetical protein